MQIMNGKLDILMRGGLRKARRSLDVDMSILTDKLFQGKFPLSNFDRVKNFNSDLKEKDYFDKAVSMLFTFF